MCKRRFRVDIRKSAFSNGVVTSGTRELYARMQVVVLVTLSRNTFQLDSVPVFFIGQTGLVVLFGGLARLALPKDRTGPTASRPLNYPTILPRPVPLFFIFAWRQKAMCKVQ